MTGGGLYQGNRFLRVQPCGRTAGVIGLPRALALLAAVDAQWSADGPNGREQVMYAVVRTYSGKGSKELFDALEKHKKDVESLLRSVKGFVSYTLARGDDGGFTVTVCQDKAGTDESVRVAKEWVAQNAGSTGVAAPKMLEGSVIIQAK
jgi:hypothetical protein